MTTQDAKAKELRDKALAAIRRSEKRDDVINELKVMP